MIGCYICKKIKCCHHGLVIDLEGGENQIVNARENRATLVNK